MKLIKPSWSAPCSKEVTGKLWNMHSWPREEVFEGLFAHFSRNYAVFLHVIVSHILHFLVQSWQVFYDFNEQLILFSSLFVMEIVNNEILWKNFQRSFEEMKSFWNLAGHVKIFRIELHRTNSCLQLLFLTILVKKFSFGDIQLLKRVQISHYFCPTR